MTIPAAPVAPDAPPLAPPLRTMIAELLRSCAADLWVREHGTNRGEVVEHVLKTVGLGPGFPWCAAWVSTKGRDVCDRRWPLQLTGGCEVLAASAASGLLLRQTPAVGAIFLLKMNVKDAITGKTIRRFAHTGFCEGMDPAGGWTTLEGNTNPDGGREGYGVFRREKGHARQFGPDDRFIWWWA